MMVSTNDTGAGALSEPPDPVFEASHFWEEKITSDLVKLGGKVQQGPWDAHKALGNTEAVTAFYSGHQMRIGRLRDRERYARWAIEEALRDYPTKSYQVTGESLREQAQSRNKSTTQVLDQIPEAAGVDGHQNIDPGSSIVPGDEPAVTDIHGIVKGAQALLTSSPNSLGPPVQPCVKYLGLETCGSYGRGNMTIWRNPKLLPKLTNENGSKGLLDTQVTAIVFLLSRLLGRLPRLDPQETSAGFKSRKKLHGPHYSGAVLADSMGFRKTLTIVALMDLMAGQRLNIPRLNGRPRYCPMLILAPSLIVTVQWAEELARSSSHIKKILVSGGTKRNFKTALSDRRVQYISKDNFDSWPGKLKTWQLSNEEASKTVLVVPLDTWSARTYGPTADKEEWEAEFKEKRRRFSLVVVDEAHRLKTKSTLVTKSVISLPRQWTILVTATPCLNAPSDLFSLAHILWSVPAAELKNWRPENWQKIESSFRRLKDLEALHKLEVRDDLYLAAAWPALLAKLLCKGLSTRRWNMAEIRAYLPHFEKLAIIRRGPGAFISQDWGNKGESVCLDGLLPKVRNYTVTVHPETELAAAYQSTHIRLLTNLLKKMNALGSAKRATVKEETSNESPVGEKLASVLTLHRQLKIASSSLDVYRLDQLLSVNGFGTKATDILKMRAAGVTFLQLGQFFLDVNNTAPVTALEWLKIAVRRSPILRYILHYLKEQVLNREEQGDIRKLLITEEVPILAYFYELVLQLLGINCRVLHAALSPVERKKLVESFNSNEYESCQVLIQMYTVGFAGSNLHKNCQRVLVASQAYSLAVQWQAIHRVIRVDQERDVEVYRLRLANSFHLFQESRQVEKLVPELAARAHGPVAKVLVNVLNHFQYEVENAWKSEEATQLILERSLLSGQRPATSTGNPPSADGHADKKQRLDDGTFSPFQAGDEQQENAPPMCTRLRLPATPETSCPSQPSTPIADAGFRNDSKKRPLESDITSAALGDNGWLHPSSSPEGGDFISLRTRSSYHEEFKSLPPAARSRFSHEKNYLRRLLSYGSDDGKPKVWTEEDLDNPAVLERALELVLRIQLGVDKIEMLPIPQIDFSLVPQDQRDLLEATLGALKKTDQDIEVDNNEDSETPTKDSLKEGLMGVDMDASLHSIEKDIDANLGPSLKLEKEDLDDQYTSSLEDTSPSFGHLAAAGDLNQGTAGSSIDDSGDSPRNSLADSSSDSGRRDGNGDAGDDDVKKETRAIHIPKAGDSEPGSPKVHDDRRDNEESRNPDDNQQSAENQSIKAEVKHESEPEIKADPDAPGSMNHQPPSQYIKTESPEPEPADDSDIEIVSVRPVRRAPPSPKVKHEGNDC